MLRASVSLEEIAQVLRHRQLRVAGAGRQVDQQDVELAPLHVLHELLHRLHHHGAPPDDGGVLIHEEAHAHHLDAVPLHRDEDRRRALALDLGPAVEPDHEGDARPVDVDVHEADAAGPPAGREHLGEGAGEVDREGALADASLSGRDGDGPEDALGGPHPGAARSRAGGRRARRLDRELDDRLPHALERAQGRLDVVLELLRHLRVVRGDRERHPGDPVLERDRLHQAEGDDIPAEPGILHLSEPLHYVFGGHAANKSCYAPLARK